jgi:hypothetical protein
VVEQRAGPGASPQSWTNVLLRYGAWVELELLQIEGLVIVAGICGPVSSGPRGSRYALGHGR